MSVLIQVGGLLRPEADQDALAEATRDFLGKIETVPGFQKAVQLVNPLTRHFQGLVYFENDDSAESFLKGDDFAHFSVFESLAAGDDIVLARMHVIE